METLRELVQEVYSEITTRQFLIEFVQGCLLIAVLVFAVPRLLKPRLAARRDRVAGELQAAETAEDELARSKREAKRLVATARKESRVAVDQACAEVEAERSQVVASTEEEADGMIAAARQTVEDEKAAVVSQACDRTVALVTVLARRYLDEALSESERRALTEKVVLSSLEGMDSLKVE